MPTANAGFGDMNWASGGESLENRGPVLYVHIGYDRAYQDGQPGRPNIPASPLLALVDTGAAVSCVDSRLARGLRLPVAGNEVMAGAHGAEAVDFYHAQIYVPDLDFVISGQLPSARLIAGRQPYFALLGRDFLSNFTMVYEGRTGLVTISSD